MNRIYFFLFLLISNYCCFSQSYIKVQAGKLTKVVDTLTPEKRNYACIEDGVGFDFNSFVLTKTEPIKKKGNQIKFRFVEEKISTDGCFRSLSLRLENNSPKSIFLKTSDYNDTISFIYDVKEFIGINNKWYAVRKIVGDCGGPIPKKTPLKSGERATISASINFLQFGSRKALFKTSILIGEKWIDSNVLEVKLSDKQYETIVKEMQPYE